MKKIATLFKRDPDDMRHVLPEVTSGCEWVLAGDGVATRKYDGTCLMFDGDRWWARREVKPGKRAPMYFVEVDHDPVTDKCVGWEPVLQTGWVRFFHEAFDSGEGRYAAGTYELCGPRINKNPEGYETHVLVRHEDAEVDVLTSNGEPRDFASCRSRVVQLGERGWEGIVWHHPDGRMAKLKARDFS